MKQKYIYTGIFLLIIFWMISPVLADAQCAMCNATATTATEGKKESALAVNRGILFLMAIPYFLLMSMVIIWWRYSKQRKTERS